VRPAPTSLPASASVKAMLPPHGASSICATKRFFCDSVPSVSMTQATVAPNM